MKRSQRHVPPSGWKKCLHELLLRVEDGGIPPEVYVRIPALALALCVSAFLPSMPCHAQSRTDLKPALAYEADPAFQEAVAKAKQLRHDRQYPFALDAWKKANKMAGGRCMKCLDETYVLQMGLQSYKDAAGTAAVMVSIADSPVAKSQAEGEQAQALLRQAGDKPKPAQLDAIHTVLQAALTDYPRNNSARWSDACVLERMGKEGEAGKAFATCAANASPTDPMRMRAEHFAAEPRLSLEKMAPAFEVTALDGQHFNLDDMGGKVVLLDFWATWCGPCNAELPHMKKIVKEFAGQPLVVLSISWDDNEMKWKDFITKNEMTWLQYRDASHELSKRFGVSAIPHYFTIDSDGALTAEIIGSGDESSGLDGRLKKLLKKAQEKPQAVAQVAAAQ
jgi:thiol-disulfide isomerase/thioredoxin